MPAVSNHLAVDRQQTPTGEHQGETHAPVERELEAFVEPADLFERLAAEQDRGAVDPVSGQESRVLRALGRIRTDRATLDPKPVLVALDRRIDAGPFFVDRDRAAMGEPGPRRGLEGCAHQVEVVGAHRCRLDAPDRRSHRESATARGSSSRRFRAVPRSEPASRGRHGVPARPLPHSRPSTHRRRRRVRSRNGSGREASAGGVRDAGRRSCRARRR